ncbi:MAG: AAA family ATPase [Rickettsiales bacterium]|nr:AAA family ATPase [Rickettsiales bacterium]
MLKNIVIEGFKSIKKVDIELKNINIVIGANGVGKSNFVRFFEFLKEQIVDNGISNINSEDIDKYLYCGKKITNGVSFEANFFNKIENCGNEYKVSTLLNSENRLIFSEEVVKFYSIVSEKSNREISLTNSLKSMLKQDTDIKSRYTRRYIEDCQVYHFNDTGKLSPFRNSSKVSDNISLEKNGANLASILYRVKNENIDIYNLILRRIKIILPFFDDFILESYFFENTENIALRWKQKGVESVYDTSMLSDGSIRFIALTVLINLPKNMRNEVILIDEPELGLHHQAIIALASMIKETSKIYDTQFIISTQSLEFLNNFDLEDIIVADRSNNQTVLKRAKLPDEKDSSKEYKEWLEQFSNSELLEQNLIGGNISE